MNVYIGPCDWLQRTCIQAYNLEQMEEILGINITVLKISTGGRQTEQLGILTVSMTKESNKSLSRYNFSLLSEWDFNL